MEIVKLFKILVSDGVWPEDLVRDGHMDFIVNKAIALGLNPIKAIQMATLNVAEHFNLDTDLGGIAPGKCADLVVIPTIDRIDAQWVISKGLIVSSKGKLEVELPYEQYSTVLKQRINLPVVEPGFFHIAASGSKVRVRIMEMITEIVTRETIVEMPVQNGAVQLMDDILKIAVIDRFEGTGKKSLGFFKGYGLRQGTIAISSSFDEGNVVVIGSNDQDMAIAVNRLHELNGGMVYIYDGEVKAEVPLSLYGYASTLTGTVLADRWNSLTTTLREMGCHTANPLLTLMTVTFSAIPSIRLTVRGYWLAKENRIVELFV